MINFYDTHQFFKTLTFRKVLNGTLLRLSYFLSRISGSIIRWGLPESLSIEPTNLCNLKCPECPSGNNGLTRPRLFLSEPAYHNLIDNNKNHLAFLQLYFQGEPFLHPKIYQYIHYATKNRIYTATSTNGQFLNPENCLMLVDSGLHRLIVSIDGTTQESYEKYRVGGSLDLALTGIENLIAAKKQRKKKTPVLIIQFVVFKTNEHQIPEIKQLAKKLKVDALKLKSPQLEHFENGHPLMPENKRYNRYKKKASGTYSLNKSKQVKCKRAWNGAVLTADNRLIPCCFDKNAKYPYGTLSEGKLKNIWKGENAHQFIKTVWSKDNPVEMCKNCTEGLKQTWF
jgi:radical SAM protein with 4Fe4S-binding SPASM domain